MSRLFLLCLLGIVFFWANTTSVFAMNAAQPGQRVALVIGNSAYAYTVPLKNPVNDAEDISRALESLGFEVVVGTDLSHNDLTKTVRRFAKRIKGAETVLFFYAGHGLQVNGVNYLIPIDARLAEEEDLEFEAIRLERIVELMERVPRTSLIFLDACRDNPLSRSLARSMGTRSVGIGRGLARIEARVGTMISFATEPGQVALDGRGRHSPFTGALLTHIATPDLDIALMMRKVRQDVILATQSKQVPWEHSSLTAPFLFNSHPANAAGAAGATGALPEGAAGEPRTVPPLKGSSSENVEVAYWNSISTSDNSAAFKAYLNRFPKGVFVELAKLKLEELDKKKLQPSKRTIKTNNPGKTPCKSGFKRDGNGNCAKIAQRKKRVIQNKKKTSRARDAKKKDDDDWACRAVWGRQAWHQCK